ncbi:molybdate ABC transporter substrate-binding protein [Shewanella surugensis]|uniref:Molybdate ABC transporter substrate-binding protein n=1 Tax=Shewanella surugensis TaxID=212020 RepID=A0ABT0L9K9_9GAMM|nr:molybdate ABC transporter substrate-binding protein [Shewanella surugensis]MCL1124398.1 molybdate ABC transporter substrate-binding protein [Shewanella surugensis]
MFFTAFSAQATPVIPHKTDIPLIAAASSIKFALDDIVKQFEADTGLSVNVSYGSSGNLVAQIMHGAPFQLFLSADESYVEQLAKVHLIKGEAQVYAIGKLALVAPKSSPLLLDKALLGVKTLLASGQLYRFAIANPRHAPYGERAQVLLNRLGLWDKIQPRLVLGENVSQAAQFVLTGAVEGGIVALSLAIRPQFTEKVNYLVLPMDLYPPLKQSMALLNKADTTAALFYQYVLSSKTQSIFKQYGFAKIESQ